MPSLLRKGLALQGIWSRLLIRKSVSMDMLHVQRATKTVKRQCAPKGYAYTEARKASSPLD